MKEINSTPARVRITERIIKLQKEINGNNPLVDNVVQAEINGLRYGMLINEEAGMSFRNQMQRVPIDNSRLREIRSEMAEIEAENEAIQINSHAAICEITVGRSEHYHPKFNTHGTMTGRFNSASTANGPRSANEGLSIRSIFEANFGEIEQEWEAGKPTLDSYKGNFNATKRDVAELKSEMYDMITGVYSVIMKDKGISIDMSKVYAVKEQLESAQAIADLGNVVTYPKEGVNRPATGSGAVVTKGRSDIIEEAVSDLKVLPKVAKYLKDKNGESRRYNPALDRIEFNVNRGVNTITAMIYQMKGRRKDVWKTAVSRCEPGEVYNEFLGKAIALRRLLEMSVPHSFIHTPQPAKEDFKVDDIVTRHSRDKGKVTHVASNSISVTWNDNTSGSYMKTYMTLVEDTARYKA